MNIDEFRKKYEKKTYIGDGLYVHFDGFHFMLSAVRENGEHWVGLEPAVFEELLEYRKKVYEDAEKLNHKNDDPHINVDHLIKPN